MAYDEEKDALIEKISKIKSDDGGSIIRVGVWSYNDGPPRVGITRKRLNKDGSEGVARLGRLTYREAHIIGKRMQEYCEDKLPTKEEIMELRKGKKASSKKGKPSPPSRKKKVKTNKKAEGGKKKKTSSVNYGGW